jgi:dipeptidyl aminopeptidase/acylaminoacyl peptidase
MPRTLTSIVLALVLVLLAGPGLGADVTLTPITFTSEGAPVQALLYQPGAGATKQPALVLSPGRIRDIKGIEWLSRALADRGYVVLAQRYRDGDVRYYGRDAEDIRNAISHLQNLPGVDPGRIGIIGHSRGGMASLLAAAHETRIRSTVALSPPTDHARYVRGLREYSPIRYAEMVKSHGGTPEEAAEYYREISPLTYADRIKTPVLLVHGTLDRVAPHDYSRWMHEALVKAGNPRAKLELLRGVGHFFEQGFGGYRHDRIVELTTSWFAETLK